MSYCLQSHSTLKELTCSPHGEPGLSNTRVHFELGTAAKVDNVEIPWPSGKTDKMTSLAADKLYSLMESKGIVPAERIRPLKKR